MAQYLTAWLPEYAARQDLRESTYAFYDGLLRNHLLPALGRIRLQDLRADHIAPVIHVADGAARSRLHRYTLLNRALADAVLKNLIAVNPCDRVERPKKGQSVEKRALTEDEIHALLTAAHSFRGAARLELPIAVLVTTGLRIGEFLALRWSDVDLGAGQFTVRRTARTYSGRGTVYSDPKTAHGRRTIELSAKIIDLLQRHRVKQHEERLQLGPIWTNNDLVFPSRVGTPWDAKNFYRDYRALVDTRSGIAQPNEINVHTLRHTAATIWIKAGVEIFTVSRRRGHSDAAFTMNRYGHLVPGMQGTAAQALDHLFA